MDETAPCILEENLLSTNLCQVSRRRLKITKMTARSLDVSPLHYAKGKDLLKPSIFRTFRLSPYLESL